MRTGGTLRYTSLDFNHLQWKLETWDVVYDRVENAFMQKLKNGLPFDDPKLGDALKSSVLNNGVKRVAVQQLRYTRKLFESYIADKLVAVEMLVNARCYHHRKSITTGGRPGL